MERVDLLSKHSQRIRDVVCELDAERVLVDERCIAKPISNGITLGRSLRKESIVGIEVQTFDLRQFTVAIAIIECEVIGIGAVTLHKITGRKDLIERPQTDIIRQEMSIVHHIDRSDMQRVGPYRVLTRVGLKRRLNDVVVERQHLTLLIEHVVTVSILQRIDMIFSRCNALNGEVSARVGLRHTQHRLLLKSRIGEIVVQSHEDTLHRFQVLSTDHIARHLQRIDVIARRERISIVTEWVTFIVITDGTGKVDGVRSIGLERVGELHSDTLAFAFNLWSLQLWGRHHDILRGIVYLDKLTEVDIYLLLVDIRRTISGISADDLRRSLVVPAAVRVAHTCTALQQSQRKNAEKQ